MKIAFVRYLTLDEVVKIHKKQIRSYGETLTSVDRNVLASSLSKVTGTLDNKEFHYNLIEKASLYMFYLTKDRPFEDGNKRTAVASTLRFLKSNRIPLKECKEKLFLLSVSIAEESCNLEQVVEVLGKIYTEE